MCANTQGYASQRSNPVFQRPKHTLGSLRGETVNRSPAETARQAGRLLSGGGGGTTTERKKNPWNFCEELEGYPDSCNSNKLDWLSDDFPPCAPAASQLTDLELRSWAGRWQRGHSAAGYTFAKKKKKKERKKRKGALYIYARSWRWCPNRKQAAVWCGVMWCGVVWCGVMWCGVVWASRTLFQGPPACHRAVYRTGCWATALLPSTPKVEVVSQLRGPVCSSQGDILADTGFNKHDYVLICV